MKTPVLILLFLFPVLLFSQQVADKSYNPEIPDPACHEGEGPVVFIDQGHHNFHTKNGRYWSFARLLERDGFRVKKYRGKFTGSKLDHGKILVISNALHKKNKKKWYKPVYSAFTEKEIVVVKKWVSEGGSLFLIADHMPLAGAASDLAAAFGFAFTNGFAFDTTQQGPDFFSLSDQTMKESVITRGRNDRENVQSVATFTGQAFETPEDAISILNFGDHFINVLPDTAWAFHDNTPHHSINGWSQLAYMKSGKGRIVVSGEAAMFTTQLAGKEKMKFGMNMQGAEQNHQLLLNIIHWLDGIIN